ncbi:MAG: DEAD/DEAH box helicase [Candidatus Altiarchaeota archaeon]|nr:DEAD/DEAH box helicase [Candidatus Altiarchaeota archaeon]
MTHIKHPLIKPETVKLRRYQETIMAAAIEKNTLVVLPTGLGKTLIAIVVIAHRLLTYPDSKALFLAPTKPLVVQHKRTFDDIAAGKKTALLTGDEPVGERAKLWKESDVIFATPQTIENDIIRGLSLHDVSLIVFDEAHRAVGDYSYVYIAKRYFTEGARQLTLGLTASPGSEKEKIKEVCENLGIRQVEAKTESDRDVSPYVQKVEVKWVKVKLPEQFLRIKKTLDDVLRDDYKALKAGGYLETSDIGKVMKRDLLELQARIRKELAGGETPYNYASIAASAMKISHATELLETQGIDSLDRYFRRMATQNTKAVKKLLRDERLKDAMTRVRHLKEEGVDHPKLDALVDIVAKRKKESMLIFTQYRDTAAKIVERLNESDILAHEFIGQTKKEGAGMSQKEQIRVLENFRAGKYTALIATSVAEEGLDIPKVDLVIFYEPIPSEIRAIQRRGRTGRSHAGEVIILMAEGTRDEAYYWVSFHKERSMRRNIKSLGKMHIKAEEEVSNPIGQQSLLAYSPKEEKKSMKVYVDNRESPYIKKLLKEKAEIELANLEVGDYILSDRTCAERKTVADFLQSMLDGRLLAQAAELSRNFERPVLILEGFRDLYTQRNIHPNAVRGALAAIATSFGIPVIPSQDEEDTAGLLLAIAKREQEYEKKEVSLRGEKKPMTNSERQQYVIESLPNVSAVLAKRLLERFDSVQNVMNAPEDELMKVDGIGDKKAGDIKKVVKSSYRSSI